MGVPEAKSISGERFGLDKMVEIININKDKSLEMQLKDMKREIDEFTGSGDPFDDVTMLIFKINDNGSE